MNLQIIRKGTPIARPRIFNLLATLKYWQKMQSKDWKEIPGYDGRFTKVKGYKFERVC